MALNNIIYNQELSNTIAVYVKKLFNKYQTSQLVYHNLNHTQNVFGRMMEISLNYSLNEIDTFVLSTATWFHDCGHLFGPATNHEAKSILVMRNHLKNIGMEEYIIQLIHQCILSTKLPNDPHSLLEGILCDADLYHLGTDHFFITDELVKKEFELRNNFLPPNWDESTLSFLESHSYFTYYCQSFLEAGKLKNINTLRERINGKR
ncbi:MAG: HD domain-containing protein [Chitinophagaceae bacterium]